MTKISMVQWGAEFFKDTNNCILIFLCIQLFNVFFVLILYTKVLVTYILVFD